MKTAKKRPFARLITANGTFITFVFCGNLPILHHDLTNVITSIIKMLSWHSEAEGKAGQVRNFQEISWLPTEMC